MPPRSPTTARQQVSAPSESGAEAYATQAAGGDDVMAVPTKDHLTSKQVQELLHAAQRAVLVGAVPAAGAAGGEVAAAAGGDHGPCERVAKQLAELRRKQAAPVGS